MSKVIRPRIPYEGPISGGIHEGKKIKIRGLVPYGAERFTINLTTGLNPSSDRLLHLSIRFDGNVVVRNTRTQNSYGTEERHGCFPFTMGSNFTMVILVESNKYSISVNGQHCWNYTHRMHFSRACSVLIDGSVNIEYIEFINKYQQPAVCPPSVMPLNISGSCSSTPTLPCTFPIHGGIRPGMCIYISGKPTSTPHKFTINLQNGTATYPPPDIAFHFDVRFFNYSIVRNSRINGSWLGEETMISHFPFQPSCHFDLIIKIQSDMYVVMLNGPHFITFRHRLTTFPKFNVLSTENDVIVTSIRY